MLRPIGDRKGYDLVIDNGSRLLKIQVKSAWFDESKKNYVVDVRRTKTNRRRMVRSVYTESDFDFAILYIPEQSIFYVMPVEIFNSYKSEIHLVESAKHQRKPKSFQYCEAWELLDKSD